MNTSFDLQPSFKMISQVESFSSYPDKQGTPEEGRRIQQLECCVIANNNNEEDKESHTKHWTKQNSLTSNIHRE